MCIWVVDIELMLLLLSNHMVLSTKELFQLGIGGILGLHWQTHFWNIVKFIPKENNKAFWDI